MSKGEREAYFNELEEASKPLIDLLYKYGDPHTKIVVDMSSVTVMQEKMGVPIPIRD